jgi:hypothetical protein
VENTPQNAVFVKPCQTEAEIHNHRKRKLKCANRLQGEGWGIRKRGALRESALEKAIEHLALHPTFENLSQNALMLFDLP